MDQEEIQGDWEGRGRTENEHKDSRRQRAVLAGGGGMMMATIVWMCMDSGAPGPYVIFILFYPQNNPMR